MRKNALPFFWSSEGAGQVFSVGRGEGFPVRDGAALCGGISDETASYDPAGMAASGRVCYN